MQIKIRDYSQLEEMTPAINESCYVLTLCFKNGECCSYAFHNGKDMSRAYKEVEREWLKR